MKSLLECLGEVNDNIHVTHTKRDELNSNLTELIDKRESLYHGISEKLKQRVNEGLYFVGKTVPTDDRTEEFFYDPNKKLGYILVKNKARKCSDANIIENISKEQFKDLYNWSIPSYNYITKGNFPNIEFTIGYIVTPILFFDLIKSLVCMHKRDKYKNEYGKEKVLPKLAKIYNL